LRVAILHPYLGLGGAERLIVDAAVELQKRGHRVTIFTGSHDPARAFDETSDGTLDVRVRGAWLPMHVGGRLRVPAAMAKMTAGALALVRADRPDVVLCDVVPHVIPLIRVLARGVPIVFYCHFPDRLLTPPRHGVYRWYRAPLDALEAAGTAQASVALVNSQYTASVFARAYPHLRIEPQVVYPGVDVERVAPVRAAKRTTLVSIARFERSKNAGLAIAAFARLREILPSASFAPLRLVMAGGFDTRLKECHDTLHELRRSACAYELQDRVDFLPSCPESDLRVLVAESLAVVYTPEYEHFGYVPVEAMAAARPVIAAASGGPMETIVDGETGFLAEPTRDAFAAAIARLVADPALADRMGQAGRERVVSRFSRSAFGERLETVAEDAVRAHR
jgi:alpha-1,3/alpha-1,6-mannosyltransferase